MSHHFIYLVNESKLRAKLKDMSVPAQESAWSAYERYAAAQTPPELHRRVRISLPEFNRQAVLPVAFALVVIVFSLLLVNFVSISNADARRSEKAGPVNASVVHPEAQKDLPAASDAKSVPEMRQAPAVAEPAPESHQELAAEAVEKPKKRSLSDIPGASRLEKIRPTMVTDDQEPDLRPE